MTTKPIPDNQSGVAPLGRAVLVRYYEPEKKKSLIVLPESVRQNEVMLEQRAQVLEIGPDAWLNGTPRAKVGDHVLIVRFCGYAFVGPKDGKSYRIVNDADIFARIDHIEEEQE